MTDPVSQGTSIPPRVQDPGAQPGSPEPASRQPTPTQDTSAPQAPTPTPAPSLAAAPAATPPGEVRIPQPSYDVVKSDRDTPEGGFKAEGHFHPTIHKIIDGDPSGGGVPTQAEALPEGPPVELQKSPSQTRTYAAIGIFLGLVVGLTLAIYFLYPGSASGSMDMGTVTSNEYGLQGHLTTKWTNKVTYNLTVEPSTPAMHPAFVSAVNNSTRPLSVSVQLKDPFGAVLCDGTILVKFDPRNLSAPIPEPDDSSKPKKKISAGQQASDENRSAVARAVDLARLESLELQREHSKDVFQPVAGTDGQVASLASQGNLPCNKKQYDGAASWTFVPDFPIIAPLPTTASGGSGGSGNSGPATIEEAARALEAKKALAAKRAKHDFAPVSPYSVEGIDTIIWYDATTGTAETSAGKAFRLDPAGAAASTLKGRDFPISIHYECDQTQGCTFTGVGLGVMHARLSR